MRPDATPDVFLASISVTLSPLHLSHILPESPTVPNDSTYVYVDVSLDFTHASTVKSPSNKKSLEAGTVRYAEPPNALDAEPYL